MVSLVLGCLACVLTFNLGARFQRNAANFVSRLWGATLQQPVNLGPPRLNCHYYLLSSPLPGRKDPRRKKSTLFTFARTHTHSLSVHSTTTATVYPAIVVLVLCPLSGLSPETSYTATQLHTQQKLLSFLPCTWPTYRLTPLALFHPPGPLTPKRPPVRRSSNSPSHFSLGAHIENLLHTPPPPQPASTLQPPS